MSLFLQIFSYRTHTHPPTHTQTPPLHSFYFFRETYAWSSVMQSYQTSISFKQLIFYFLLLFPRCKAVSKIVLLSWILATTAPPAVADFAIKLTHGVCRFMSRNEIILEIIALTLLKNRLPHDHLVPYQFTSLIIQELVNVFGVHGMLNMPRSFALYGNLLKFMNSYIKKFF